MSIFGCIEAFVKMSQGTRIRAILIRGRVAYKLCVFNFMACCKTLPIHIPSICLFSAITRTKRRIAFLQHPCNDAANVSEAFGQENEDLKYTV